MGQPKTDRTQQLHAAARCYTVAQQANRAIEQHSFDKLVAQGTIETLLVNASPGTGDEQLNDYYEKHREGGLKRR